MDIKINKFVLSWGKVPAKVQMVCKDKNGKKIATSTAAANTGSIALNNSVFKGREGYSGGVTIEATVPDSNKTASINLLYPAKSFSLIKRGTNNNSITVSGVTAGGELQYSSSSSFKTYKAVMPTSNSVTIKNLSKNKTYYFRFRNRLTVNTENGKKTLNGDWSSTLKAKTANITMKTPVIKSPKVYKTYTMFYWKKYTGTANKHEIVVATNKAFTKNVKKTAATKSMTSIGISKLKKKTKYYVKMRSVYTLHGATYYSKWSSVKSFKTK